LRFYFLKVGGDLKVGLLLSFFFEDDQDAGRYSYYGIMGLRHRGYRACYAVLNGDDIEVGRVNPWSESWSLPSGHAVVAGIEPIASMGVTSKNGRKVVVISEGACNPDSIAQLIASSQSVDEAASSILSKEALDSCAFIGLTSDGNFVAFRGKNGIRPLSLGGYGFESVYFATETAPISLMGGEYRYDLRPGEVIYGSKTFMESFSLKSGIRATSLFEYIYLARPDSYVDGVNVYLFRKAMGAKAAKRHKALVDVVVGVPETALPYALGYSEEKRVPMELAFVSTIGRVRTAVAPLSHEERLMTLSLKLNPVPQVFEGKSVAIVDDSVVTGLTLKTVIHRLRRTQAVKEVHVIVSSPKIVDTCPYGVNRTDPHTLIARVLSDEEIRRALDADELVWLSLDDALEYLNSYGINPCRRCMKP
jgi:amidophosphoribosyltransferase